jgi:hypothetical protein
MFYRLVWPLVAGHKETSSLDTAQLICQTFRTLASPLLQNTVLYIPPDPLDKFSIRGHSSSPLAVANPLMPS